MSDAQVKGMLQSVENLWACFDELIDSLKTANEWAVKHGADWTLADVPYHMMYADRDLVAGALRRGEDVPSSEQRVQRTLRQLNEWNAAMFATRPTGQTPEQSVSQWRAVRNDVRKEIGTLQDEDLMGKRVWFPLVGCGWVPAMVSVGFSLAHTWSEFIQFRYHLNRSAPEPDPAATHGSVGFLVNLLPAFMNPEAAKGVRFTAVMAFNGPGGGDWTLRIEDGQGSVTEESASNPDMVMTQTPEAFELMRQGKLDPAAAMKSGAVQIQGMEHMTTYAALFPPPDLDATIEPMGVGALG